MSLLYIDSFDHYTSGQLSDKWTTASGTIVTGRHGSGFSSNGARKGLTFGSTTVVVGLAFNAAGLGFTSLISYADTDVNTQIQIGVLLDGSVQVRRFSGATLGLSAPGTIQANQWYYIEFKATIHASTGAFEVRLNGATLLSGSGVNTTHVSGAWNGTLGSFSINNSLAGPIDDLYCLDGAGATHNDFLGDVEIAAVYPDDVPDAGFAAEWSSSSANPNWQNIDEVTANDDTDYNFTDVLNEQDIVNVEDIGSVTNIIGAQLLISARKTEEVDARITPIARQDGVNYLGTEVALGTTYFYGSRTVYGVCPDGSAWTAAKFNAMQFGYKKTL